MHEATPPADAPDYTVELLHGNLQLMDSALRLYGHPGLLAVAEAVLGPDFVPYNEVTFIKEPGLGPSVAWHRTVPPTGMHPTGITVRTGSIS